MDSRFEATPSADEVSAALEMWPELTGKRLRPLLVTAFGDIYVELDTGEVYVAKPLELSCERVTGSVQELEKLFADTAWAQQQLISEMALLASERCIPRQMHQVYAVAPHPTFSGRITIEGLMAMDLKVWHSISTQLRTGDTSNKPTPNEKLKGFFNKLLRRS